LQFFFKTGARASLTLACERAAGGLRRRELSSVPEVDVIARIWRGTATTANAAAYDHHFTTESGA
jgi:hypothetical protein